MKSRIIVSKRMVKDPVCGMEIDPESSFGSYEYEGRTYFFCNQYCLEKFKVEPAKYLTDKLAISQELSKPRMDAKDNVYICPMDSEVRQQIPGSCPKCGMVLEQLTISTPETRIEYTCPMHPEIVRDEPGFCPLCGMALEPRTVSVEETNEELLNMTRR
ncbi:MAG TPA: heavy metal-binding domain-containing protein, partial [Thermodesulfobacteriota bacterium]